MAIGDVIYEPTTLLTLAAKISAQHFKGGQVAANKAMEEIEIPGCLKCEILRHVSLTRRERIIYTSYIYRKIVYEAVLNVYAGPDLTPLQVIMNG